MESPMAHTWLNPPYECTATQATSGRYWEGLQFVSVKTGEAAGTFLSAPETQTRWAAVRFEEFSHSIDFPGSTAGRYISFLTQGAAVLYDFYLRRIEAGTYDLEAEEYVQKAEDFIRIAAFLSGFSRDVYEVAPQFFAHAPELKPLYVEQLVDLINAHFQFPVAPEAVAQEVEHLTEVEFPNAPSQYLRALWMADGLFEPALRIKTEPLDIAYRFMHYSLSVDLTGFDFVESSSDTCIRQLIDRLGELVPHCRAYLALGDETMPIEFSREDYVSVLNRVARHIEDMTHKLEIRYPRTVPLLRVINSRKGTRLTPWNYWLRPSRFCAHSSVFRAHTGDIFIDSWLQEDEDTRRLRLFWLDLLYSLERFCRDILKLKWMPDPMLEGLREYLERQVGTKLAVITRNSRTQNQALNFNMRWQSHQRSGDLYFT